MEENNVLTIEDTAKDAKLVEAASLDDASLDSKTGLLKPRRRRRVSLDARKARSGYIFVLPFILGIVLIYLPILLDSIWFSLGQLQPTIIDGVPGKELVFVGFKNYVAALTDSSGFVTSLTSGIQQLVFEVPAVIVFSLFIAVVLNQKMLGRAAFRAIFFVPVIIATGLMESINATDIMTDSVGSGIDDGTGMQAGEGIISVLDVTALFEGMGFGGAKLVVYVVNLVNNVYNIINYSGVQMLIFLAGLQSISPSIYEACQIEGATGWETFWKITFPMISPMILVNAVYTTIDAFTRSDNVMMKFIDTVKVGSSEKATAMYWIYFGAVALIIAVVAAISSTFIFYQRRD